ncbi:hypothetical protein Bpfe_005717 [Biomphalaria pfeifferi]|uniref:Uncharacterized protein n=1 Tax=Biomphalaria pfeifferi TaxID=112525 RepID=A0AAD8C2M3_BIOPF|nr:hypothetical protein Bpfe_005717 [Biomphalaria pfeifferi]
MSRSLGRGGGSRMEDGPLQCNTPLGPRDVNQCLDRETLVGDDTQQEDKAFTDVQEPIIITFPESTEEKRRENVKAPMPYLKLFSFRR